MASRRGTAGPTRPHCSSQTVAALAILARRHDLGMLIRLLEMAQMEAEEFVRLRGKRKLS